MLISSFENCFYIVFQLTTKSKKYFWGDMLHYIHVGTKSG